MSHSAILCSTSMITLICCFSPPWPARTWPSAKIGLLHIYRSREFIFTAWIQHFFVSKSTKASSYQSCVLYTVQSYIYIFTGWWFQPLWKILIKWDIVPKIWKNIKCSKAPTSHKWRFLNWGYHKIIQNQTIHFVLKPMVTLGSPISKPPKFWKQSCTWPPANHEYSVFCILNIHVWFFSANHWHALTTVPLINPFVSHS